MNEMIEVVVSSWYVLWEAVCGLPGVYQSLLAVGLIIGLYFGIGKITKTGVEILMELGQVSWKLMVSVCIAGYALVYYHQPTSLIFWSYDPDYAVRYAGEALQITAGIWLAVKVFTLHKWISRKHSTNKQTTYEV